MGTDIYLPLYSSYRSDYPDYWKRPWCLERLKAGGEGNDRGWDGWMASTNSMDLSLRDGEGEDNKKGPSSQGYGFSSGHVWMQELDREEGWALKNWCFWTVVLEKTLESPLDYKKIQTVHSKGDQPWVFFRRNEAKAETPVFWPPHAKSWLIGKASDAGRDWGQEEKGMTEDEMAGWHHWLDGRESE